MAITKQDVAYGWLAIVGVTLGAFVLGCVIYGLWTAPWPLVLGLVFVGITVWAMEATY